MDRGGRSGECDSRTAAAEPVRVAFVDLRPVHEPLKALLLDDLSALIDDGGFVNGPAVDAFERALAAYCGRELAVGLSSGLDALRLGLLAQEVGHGDEVIVPANTFAATVEAIMQTGATPVLVDATDRDYNIDVSAVETALTERTAVVVPVHLYGQLADMAALTAMARRHGVMVLEDACQAHGAIRDGVCAGACGVAAGFSFYPAKNLGALGDAGALVMDDDGLAARVRSLREHGQRAKYWHEDVGFTARLDAFQARVLLRKLPLLDGWNEARRAAAELYGGLLAGVGDLRLPPVPVGSIPAWHLYVVCTAEPEALGAHLAKRGIATGRHYPHPIHLSPAYAGLGHGRGAFPVAERLARHCLSLPLYPGISEGQLTEVAEGVRSFFDG